MHIRVHSRWLVFRPVMAVVALAFGLSAAARADVRAQPSPLEGDRTVVGSVVGDVVTEFTLCTAALERTQNAEIRTFCRRASADDARTALAGMQLAAQLDAADVSLAPPPRAAEIVASFGRYSGREFDRYFLLCDIGNNENTLNTLRYDIDVTTDRSVRRFENAAYTLVLRHLDLAENALRHVSEALP